MELLAQPVDSHKLFLAFAVLMFNFYLSSSLLQGNGLPYMTSNVKQVLGKSFDYIIIGGGTTGCPLAATLSKRFSVLLIERGSSPYENPLVTEKRYYGFSLLQNDKFSSIAQSFTSQDGVPNLRGRVLGGSSAINGGFYSRASKDFVTKAGWDEELVERSYEWVESKVVFTPKLTPWQTVVGFGLLEAGVQPYNGFSLEHLGGTKVGGSVFDGFGKRHSSADLLAAGNAKNIMVLLNATVKNILFDYDEANHTRTRGVRFIKSDGSSKEIYEAHLRQSKKSNPTKWGEVILSAGALGSPQILLLSGIGPHQHLQRFNIPLTINSLGVGSNMKDNPSFSVFVDKIPKNRLPDPPEVVGIADRLKFIIQALVLPISSNATRMPIAAKLAFPISKGKLRLNSTDPRDNPLVKFNYLKKDEDLDECARMVNLLMKVSQSDPVVTFLGKELKPKDNLVSNTDELRKMCRKNVRTFYHYHGGCLVGSVVDSDYRVYGVKGLRVIDGSTIKESPGSNPMATLMMLGRYQGIKILEEKGRS